MTAARCPAWALADGMPPPNDGEDFAAYWSRMGIAQDVIDGCLNGLSPRVEEIANDRMANYLHHELPGAFQRYVNAMSNRGRGLGERVGSTQPQRPRGKA